MIVLCARADTRRILKEDKKIIYIYRMLYVSKEYYRWERQTTIKLLSVTSSCNLGIQILYYIDPHGLLKFMYMKVLNYNF